MQFSSCDQGAATVDIEFSTIFWAQWSSPEEQSWFWVKTIELLSSSKLAGDVVYWSTRNLNHDEKLTFSLCPAIFGPMKNLDGLKKGKMDTLKRNKKSGKIENWTKMKKWGENWKLSKNEKSGKINFCTKIKDRKKLDKNKNRKKLKIEKSDKNEK